MRTVAERAAAEGVKPKKPVETFQQKREREAKANMLADLNASMYGHASGEPF